MDDVLSTFNIYKNQYFPKVSLTSKVFDQLSNQDSLYFLEHDSHCFVLLHYAERNFGCIADGGNFFLDNIETCKELRELLGIRLRACKFEQQMEIDHRASSGILIALEFVRAYRNKLVPTLLSSHVSWQDRVITRLHKHESTSAKLPPPHLCRRMYKCNYCQRSFLHSRNRLEKHMRTCNKDK